MPLEKLKKIATDNLNKSEEGVIMTTAERLINQGKKEGLSQGMQQSIIDILESRLNSVDKQILNSLTKIQNFDKLRTIAKRASLVNLPEELDIILNYIKTE